MTDKPINFSALKLFRPAKSKIVKTIIQDGREWQLHATKGWRSFRLTTPEKDARND